MWETCVHALRKLAVHIAYRVVKDNGGLRLTELVIDPLELLRRPFPDLNPKRPINCMGASSDNMETVKAQLLIMKSWVRFCLLMQTETVAGSDVIWQTVWRSARSASRPSGPRYMIP